MMKFVGKVAAVTGGASGIGYAVAEYLVAEGATVAILDLAHADIAAKDLGATGYTVDVADPASVESALQSLVAHHGGLHLMVNNAGIDGGSFPLADYPLEEFDRVIGVNLRGVFLGMRYAIPHILASGGGAIVNMASVAGVRGVPTLAPYSASKAAIISLTRTAAVEYSSQGVRINAILPGAIETPMMAKIFEETPGMREPIVAGHPIGRTGTAVEIAAAVAFLLSEEADFITGTALSVDGGYSAA
jgi:NAD(P)-dependent dehydrogenase (short-subunit alcohol dehydrogenase family)